MVALNVSQQQINQIRRFPSIPQTPDSVITLQLSRLKSKINLLFAIWWISVVVSYYFGPYTFVPGPYRFLEAGPVFDVFNKTFLFYFLSVVCIDDDRKFRYLTYVMLGSIAYLVYWANMQYFDFGYRGRLSGPTSRAVNAYGDENAFAAVFVVGLPFIYYWGLNLRAVVFRYAVWLIIPLGWHAIFLTGSRGGLLGLAATLLVVILRAKHSLMLGALLIPVFVGAFIWQAGPVLKERAGTIPEYQSEDSATARLEAWAAATQMIIHHPITGVGLSSFGPAYADYSNKRPRQAHNTFFQSAAESGLLAGLAWAAILATSLVFLWRTRSSGPFSVRTAQSFESRMKDALLAALVGFGVCAMFLSLETLEIYFYFGLLVNYLMTKERNDYVSGDGRHESPALRANFVKRAANESLIPAKPPLAGDIQRSK